MNVWRHLVQAVEPVSISILDTAAIVLTNGWDRIAQVFG